MQRKMAAMQAGIISVVLIQITLCSSPPLMKRCDCLIVTDEASGSLKADCSNRPKLNFDFACLASQRPESLDLSGNGLQEVPAELNLTGFQDLKHLDLSRNKISSLKSYNFGTWTRLDSLNISHNCLTDLPGKGPPIRTIDVSYNQLTEMRSIFGLTYTNAIVLGNPILCKCNSSLVQQMYSLISSEGRTVIECALHDKDPPKPISVQCHNDIDKVENPSFSICIFSIPFIFIIIIFSMTCNLRHINIFRQ